MDGNSGEKREGGAAIMQHYRIRACDICRKKKIRCQAVGEDCLQCVNYKIHCIFTPVDRKKRSHKPAKRKNIEELESRLKRMETLLQASVKRNESESGAKNAYQSPSSMMDLQGKENEDVVAEERGFDIAPPAWGQISAIATRRHSRSYDTTSLFIPSKASSATRPLALDGNASNKSFETSQLSTQYWTDSLLSRPIHRHVFQKLPPKFEALLLIEEAFQSFNASFPIFEHFSFIGLVHENYSDSDQKDLGWWASLNVVFAMAHRFRAMRTLQTEVEDRLACGYMQNALAVVSELTMLPPSLFAVQALLGMAIVLKGTPNPRLCSMLIAATIRLAQDLGLHRRGSDLTLSDAEIEQRKRVFWIAYLVDKDISLRTGQPPAQSEDDIDVDFPRETVSDLMLHRKGVNSIYFLNFHIQLAVIQGQIYKSLYSAKALKQPEADRLLVAQKLDSRLAAWKASLPTDFQADCLNTTIKAPFHPAILHKMILHFTYVNCLIQIHRLFPDWDLASSVVVDPAERLQNLLSDGICVTEARKSIQLLQITPQGDYACVWHLVHAFFATVITLLQNVLRSPSSFLARSDLQLIEPFLELLKMLAKEKQSQELQRMYEFCDDFNKRAKEAVTCMNKRIIHGAGRGKDERESVDEFIRRIDIESGAYGNFVSLLTPIPSNNVLGDGIF